MAENALLRDRRMERLEARLGGPNAEQSHKSKSRRLPRNRKTNSNKPSKGYIRASSNTTDSELIELFPVLRWIYTSGDNLQMGIHLGTVATYGGGGYYLDLPQDKNMALKSVAELFQNLWVDRGTSAIFIHFTVYNPNANLFCVVS